MYRNGITISWQNCISVTSLNMEYADFLTYLEYQGTPFDSIDSVINFANWCVNRGFQTYIYPDKSTDIRLKIAVKILCWTGSKIGKLSNRLIRGCPNHV